MRPTPSMLLTLTLALTGCGAMAASRGRTAYVAAHGQLPLPEEIRVDEYLADYDESLPDPAPYALGMTLQGARAAWGGESSEPLFVAQVAVRARDSHVRPPLSLMLVVDRSGSMQEQDKMTFVRAGLHQLVGQLDPSDRVGITAFDDRADVLLPLVSVGEGDAIHRAIDQLVPRGGTNLSEGLRVGYEAIEGPASVGTMRRVVLLTDAMANVGDTDMYRIAHQARQGDAAGVRLSAVGVGLQYQDAVLVEMARQGYGNHYFLDSPERIHRVFSAEVEGLLEDVADQAYLTFSPAPGVEVVRVEGLDVETSGEHWRMELGRMGAGQHRVALITLRGVDPLEHGPTVGRFTLDYVDMRAGEPTRQTEAEPVRVVEDAAEGTVARNSAVAWMARDLRDVAELARSGQYDDAERRLDRARAVISAVAAARPNDTQLAEDLETLDGFARALASHTGHPYRVVRARVRVSMEGG
ncbi:MAG: VWA domain-containing protein [Sandaracinaceae bacterium]|nr:VWA domain-containing protein [Sandaracinaceae bacterium]